LPARGRREQGLGEEDLDPFAAGLYEPHAGAAPPARQLGSAVGQRAVKRVDVIDVGFPGDLCAQLVEIGRWIGKRSTSGELLLAAAALTPCRARDADGEDCARGAEQTDDGRGRRRRLVGLAVALAVLAAPAGALGWAICRLG
jgi:hypothetical protein